MLCVLPWVVCLVVVVMLARLAMAVVPAEVAGAERRQVPRHTADPQHPAARQQQSRETTVSSHSCSRQMCNVQWMRATPTTAN